MSRTIIGPNTVFEREAGKLDSACSSPLRYARTRVHGNNVAIPDASVNHSGLVSIISGLFAGLLEASIASRVAAS